MKRRFLGLNIIVVMAVLVVTTMAMAKTVYLTVEAVEGRNLLVADLQGLVFRVGQVGIITHNIIAGGKTITLPIGKVVVAEVSSDKAKLKLLELAQGWKLNRDDKLRFEVDDSVATSAQPTDTTTGTDLSDSFKVPTEYPPAAAILTSQEGPLQLTVNFSDQAVLFVDRKMIGTGPSQVLKIATGKHLVRINVPDFAPFVDTLDLSEAKSWLLEVTLAPSTKTLFFQGYKAYQVGKNDEAVKYFSESAKYLPFISENLYWLGVIRQENEDSQAAIELFRLYLNYALDPRGHLHLAQVYEGDKETGKAFVHYKKAVELLTNFVVTGEINSSQQGLAETRRELSRNPTLDNRFLLALILEQRGELAEGVRVLKQILKAKKAQDLEGLGNNFKLQVSWAVIVIDCSFFVLKNGIILPK